MRLQQKVGTRNAARMVAFLGLRSRIEATIAAGRRGDAAAEEEAANRTDRFLAELREMNRSGDFGGYAGEGIVEELWWTALASAVRRTGAVDLLRQRPAIVPLVAFGDAFGHLAHRVLTDGVCGPVN